MAIIYKIVNPQGCIYIGQTVNKSSRIASYKRLDCKKQKLIYYSIIKYGWDSHTFEVIEELEKDSIILNDREIYWIDFYKSNRCKYSELKGLNLTDGGGGTLGVKKTPEQLEKMCKFPKGVSSWNKGKKCDYLDELIKANTTRKYIYVYDKTGEFIKEYNAVKSASTDLKIGRSQISGNAKGKSKHVQTLRFRFEKVDKLEPLTEKDILPKKRILLKFIDTGIIKKYNNIEELSDEVKLTIGTLYSYISKNLTVKNIHYSYF